MGIPNSNWPNHEMNTHRTQLLSTRVSVKGSGFAREYHVQFFGKAVQRAWVASSALLPFEGLEAFHAKAREVKGEVGKAKTKQKLLKVSCDFVYSWQWQCEHCRHNIKYQLDLLVCV